jgi:hypothetical protein
VANWAKPPCFFLTHHPALTQWPGKNEENPPFTPRFSKDERGNKKKKRRISSFFPARFSKSVMVEMRGKDKTKEGGGEKKKKWKKKKEKTKKMKQCSLLSCVGKCAEAGGFFSAAACLSFRLPPVLALES